MGRRLARVGLLILMALATFNLLVGAPIFSIWVGSRVQGDKGGISMTALVVVILVLAFIAWLLVRALDWLGRAHDRASGIERKRRQTTWLKAMSGERRDGPSTERVRALDVVLVIFVVLAVIAFELWLLLFAGSPLPGG
jgi:hypothetical protein